MDGDARGGAALSVRQVTGRPIAFVGVGEKTDALEPFHPDRLAARILGMGDVLSLVEKAQATVDQAQAEELAQKIRDDDFSLEDFADPAQAAPLDGPARPDHGHDARSSRAARRCRRSWRARRRSWTASSAIIALDDAATSGASRRSSTAAGAQRIARGSGTSVPDVNRLLKQYAQLKKMMKGLKQMEGRMGKLQGRLPFLPR